MKQSFLDRIRVLNKHVTNKLLVHISGKKFGHFVILSHVGRKSGKFYRIPIIAEPIENGFVIALTYGKKVDWYENVMANGVCSIIWKNMHISAKSHSKTEQSAHPEGKCAGGIIVHHMFGMERIARNFL